MVNYRRVVCEVAVLLAAAALAAAAPLHDCKDDRVFDQRQNGTENYRVNIDGVVIAVAPAESLLNAISDIDLTDLLADFDFEQDQKPKPPSELSDFLTGETPPAHKPDEVPVLSKPGDKPSEAKPEDKPEEHKPEPEAPLSIPEKQHEKGHKKSAQLKKQENAQR